MRPDFLTPCFDEILVIKENIAQYSPSAATRFVDSVFSRVEQLEKFPYSGRMVPEVGQPAVRELFHRQYRIIYRLHANGRIDVLGVRSSLVPLDTNF